MTRFVVALLLTTSVGCSAIDNFSVFMFPSGSDGGTDGGSGGGGDMAPVLCGAAGQPCCNTGDPCLGGGCCVATSCHRSGESGGAGSVCLEGNVVACGADGQPCCENNGCKTNGCCVGGECFMQGSSCGNAGALNPNGNCSGGATMSPTCAPAAVGSPCGGQGQSCCTGSRTASAVADYCVASGLACNPGSGKCETCGADGEACCDGNACTAGCCDAGQNGGRCVKNGSGCSGNMGDCTASGCLNGACGRIGEPCCAAPIGCTATAATCQSGVCVPCGGLDLPCCPGHGGGWCGEPYVCGASGTCRHCGVSGQPCCAGDSCTGSSKCIGGTCS